ncbi:hypothetical protein SEA_CLUBPENGUIN_33 [Streptomyces phage ClubPenguin]|nr:hypothetical protein SEA_CLUBPENGUIN_33 [Streptomyces phage ClubPenguin]
MQKLPYFLVVLGFLALMGEFYPMAFSCFIIAYATREAA